MAKLYYGSGTCSIEGSDISAVHIHYKGAIEVDDKTSDNYTIIMGNQQIIIFPISAQTPLNDLFTYRGNLNITSITVVDSNAQIVPSLISRVMDYPEILHTKSEDMTMKVEEMSAGHQYGGIRTNSLIQSTIDNLHTSTTNKLYLKDGTQYGGAYHVHKKNSKAMTGATHDKASEDLYFYIDNELIPTKNESHIPLANKKRGKRKTTRATKPKIKTTPTGGMGGY